MRQLTQAIALPGRTTGWGAAFFLVALSARIVEIITPPLGLGVTRSRLSTVQTFLGQILSQEAALQGALLLGGLAALATVAFLLCVLFDAEKVSFTPIFSLLVQTEGILVARDLVNVLLLSLDGSGPLLESSDLLAIPGFNLLVTGIPANPGLLYFLNCFNPFGAWYIVTFSSGVRSLGNIPNGSATTAAIVIFVLRSGIPALVLGVISSSHVL